MIAYYLYSRVMFELQEIKQIMNYPNLQVEILELVIVDCFSNLQCEERKPNICIRLQEE